MPKSAFGLPGQLKYPVDTDAHAIDAKSRAKQQYNKGKLTGAQLRQIDAKANHRLESGK